MVRSSGALTAALVVALLHGCHHTHARSAAAPHAARGQQQQQQGVVPCTGSCSTLQLESGQINGKSVLGSGSHFLGVPFAAPPVGSLRWEPPQAVPAWNGTRTATKYSASCMQSAGSTTKFAPPSEVCLHLSVCPAPQCVCGGA